MNVDEKILLKHLVGGLLTGGGVASAVMLGRHLAALQRRAKQQRYSDRDDDTVTLVVPERGNPAIQKRASANKNRTGDNAVSAALNYLAIILGGAGGYIATERLYNNYRKKSLQKEIDQAQRVYMDLSQDKRVLSRGGNPSYGQIEKHAAAEFSTASNVLGVPLALGALLALASGVVTNKILEKQFPKPTDPAKTRPSTLDVRIERAVRGVDTSVPAIDVEVVEPSTESSEALMRQSLAKTASVVTDLVCMVASGRGYELKQAVEDYGWEHAAELCKRANTDKGPAAWKKHLAISALAHDPILSPGVTFIAAAENLEDSPGMVKVAAYVDEEFSNDLVNLYEATNAHTRESAFRDLIPLNKKAAVSAALSTSANAWMPKVIIADVALRRLAQEANEGSEEDLSTPITSLKLTDEDIALLREVYGIDIIDEVVNAEGLPPEQQTGVAA